MTPRQTSEPSFWDERYRLPEPPFGTGPNAFVASQADRLDAGCDVLDLGAGDGRNAIWLASRGHAVTALDFSTVGLHAAMDTAALESLPLTTLQEDLANWRPERTWDAVVCTFVHLMPDERRRLYASVDLTLRPGGILIAEWFAPENLTIGGPGPSTPDRLVSVEELHEALRGGTLALCQQVVRTLDEGTFLQGGAATVQVVYVRGADG